MALTLTPRGMAGGTGRQHAPLRRETGSIAIGRDAGCDLPLDHPLVSSRHCTITGGGGDWRLSDTSTNGTLLNGARVAMSAALRDGDVIGIGGTELIVGIDGATAAAAASMRLDDWGRAQAAAPPVAPAPTAAPVKAAGGDMLSDLLAEQVAGLVRARRAARAQLGAARAGSGDPFDAASDADAARRLRALPPGQAAAAVAAARVELDAHERALLGAMQRAFVAALDHFAPAAIRQRSASDAEAWAAYARAFDARDGFVESFAQEAAKAYREMAGG